MPDAALSEPFAQFATWMEEAKASEPNDPNAMTLATATPDGRPSARTVLLKGWDEGGFVFYTNLQSRKGAELLANRHYLDLLMQASDRLGAWIVQAQADGDIDPTLPPELVLYTIYARACDPVPAYLKAGGAFSDAQVVELVQRTCWNGLKPLPKA
jgi:hypothetical protein